MYSLLRPLLFRADSERAHERTVRAAERAQRLPGFRPAVSMAVRAPRPALARTVWGIRFRSPLGLAAGLDKDARLLPTWDALGLGFVEVGTVTPRPQQGNPRPRMFRYPEAGAILNRMGFNSEGAEAVAGRLQRRPSGLVVGVNIGKNRATAQEAAAEDYLSCYRTLAGYADYTVLNLSSPNTPGLRSLQSPQTVFRLLELLLTERDRMQLSQRPLLLKLAPDLHPDELAEIVRAALAGGADGLVVGNTTVNREILPRGTRRQVDADGDGGLSGAPLRATALRAQLATHRALEGRAPWVACGGIGDISTVTHRLNTGAALVQLYSALVFRGPGLIGDIHAKLAANV